MIETAHLDLHIGDTQILNDISLRIEPGVITGLIGPNGAGKSTLLHCLAGLTPVTGGTVRIDGQDPFSADDTARARMVALLQQSPAIVSRLRVHELVAFGRWPHHQGRPGPDDARHVDEALEAFDLTALADRPLETLSGGQRQRAFVAMTYAQDTPWILLDEPLNALDPRHARNLMARLDGLARTRGRSIVIVVHDINAAARWADRIVAMKDSRVLAQGPTQQVLTPATLLDCFDTPFDTIPHKGRTLVVAQ
ncbi:ABC transporter ATP-binding protein [Actibacterium ureilyticum]|uniref:iron ABC transporter ATP-binding protein n=1 Tax=Actibacterium ureilyticum TaxID=1590614 RepID=UPI000BAAFC18|nr:ATP-binding cassette domain-containing protein [Actibacterium ureilyticum]